MSIELDFSLRLRALVEGQSHFGMSRAAKQENGRTTEGGAEGDAEQTGSNLIIRNAPELGNEGLSFRLTPSGLVDVIHLFVWNAGLPLFSLVRSLSFRYLASRPCRRVSRSFASRRWQIERMQSQRSLCSIELRELCRV
jgi:hypothetical protein